MKLNIKDYDIPSTIKLQNLLQRAKNQKTSVVDAIEEVSRYIDALLTVDGTTTSLNRVDLTIQDCTSSFSNFIMESVFGVKTNFAKNTVAENTLNKKYKGEAFNKKREEINSFLETQTDTVFKYIFSSNFYSEISQAIENFSSKGTGSYKIYATTSNKKPFIFENVPLYNLYFLEDAFGKPEYNFQEIRKVPVENVYQKYRITEEIREFSNAQDQVSECDIIEFCVPVRKKAPGITFDEDEEEEETVYYWGVADLGMTKVYKYELVPYNVFKTFRFSKVEGFCWGEGLGLLAIDAFERLTYYKQMQGRYTRKFVDPPMAIAGEPEYLNDLSAEPGAINYVGDGQFNMYPLFQQQQIYDLKEVIAVYKDEIRQIFMAQPLGTTNESDFARSTEEIQYRISMLKSRHAGTTELIYQELLEPTFYAPYNILLEKKLIDKPPKEIADDVEVLYINELTRYNDMEKVYNYTDYNNIVKTIYPGYSQLPVLRTTTIPKIATLMNIPTTDVYTADELEKNMQSIMAQQQAFALAQVNAKNGGSSNGQITSDITGGEV